ncbi:hypothetical protein K9N68_33790 [Kovacikia minuta CCNUW1]|uniref:hypothetical protein n=1 Tax=Kovacikia minuta TaxID=2931930 RepID=UPI001CCB3464|nr:hypothetical protein [Kovacikia minuta]UBF26416.1 hypothetical protein K9N68_33790 [Kovacikia minuta CCNUW1]
MKTPTLPTAKTSATCSQCVSYSEGVCRLKAEAGWDDASFVKPSRPICLFCELLPV